jgi:hypothetical protein
VSGTWGAPDLETGLDKFTARQKPDVHPVDDLSRFVMDRIIAAEAEPKTEVPQVYGQPAGPIAHRYAAAVRRDMAVFRNIVDLYIDAERNQDGDGFQAGAQRYMESAMLVLANRFSDHPDFRDEWRQDR